MNVKTTRLPEPLQIDAKWDKSQWAERCEQQLHNHMREKPIHFPETKFKVAYDEDALYVIFQVQDQYVRAVAEKYQDPVCLDSCVEFFFTPNETVPESYFNLEINCGGKALFAFQRDTQSKSVPIPESDFQKITLAHSQPETVSPEIEEPVTWTVEYRLPIDVLEKFSPVTRPQAGVKWRANFYKCADHSSHPHWLTWAPVNYPKPKFHLPQFFGHLEFA